MSSEPKRTIDLNADLGEYPEDSEQDRLLMGIVTSANIACGGHAGDEHTMRRTLQLAKEFGVAAGAHPSFPDRENFGRFPMDMEAAALERSLAEQIEALRAIALEVGIRVTHVKPHGALYHAASNDAEVAHSIAKVIREIDPGMIAVGQAGSPVMEAYREIGLRTAAEAFADRAYEANGALRSRKLPGALHENPDVAARQALDIALYRRVVLDDGAELAIEADTLCLHSDTPNSVVIAKEIRRVLEQAGIRMAAFG